MRAMRTETWNGSGNRDSFKRKQKDQESLKQETINGKGVGGPRTEVRLTLEVQSGEYMLT